MSGEFTFVIRNGLKRSATKLVGKEEDLVKLEKQLDEAVVEENRTQRKLTQDEKEEILYELKKSKEDFSKYQNNLNSLRLKRLALKEWKQLIESKGGKLRFFDESEEVVELQKIEKFDAMFRGTDIPPTIWIPRNTTDLVLFHESMHFEDFLRRGKENYLRGGTRKLKNGKFIEVPERDKLIRSYLREKYVHEKILEEQENWIKKYGKGRWTEDEIEASLLYFTEDYELPCIFEGIDIKNLEIKE